MTIEAIYTPGHVDDHVSFSITEEQSAEKVLISGDVFLGSPSCSFQDLSAYIKSMKLLKEMNFDWILLPHSLGWAPEQVMVDAKTKIDDYLKYRNDRLIELLACFDSADHSSGGEEPRRRNREQLYEHLYAEKGLTGHV